MYITKNVNILTRNSFNLTESQTEELGIVFSHRITDCTIDVHLQDCNFL